MVATNAVAPRTGNVSAAGTSIFAMVVLESKKNHLSKVYTEIDVVTTPSGKDVAMVHCNTAPLYINAWIGLLRETLGLFGCNVSAGEVFTKLYQKSLEGEADCGGVLVYITTWPARASPTWTRAAPWWCASRTAISAWPTSCAAASMRRSPPCALAWTSWPRST